MKHEQQAQGTAPAAVGAPVEQPVRPLDLAAIRFLASGQDDPQSRALRECAAELSKLRATLAMVADIAHSGGLALHSDFTALTAIRRLTLEAWNRHGTEAEHRKRVNDAGREAVRRSGA